MWQEIAAWIPAAIALAVVLILGVSAFRCFGTYDVEKERRKTAAFLDNYHNRG